MKIDANNTRRRRRRAFKLNSRLFCRILSATTHTHTQPSAIWLRPIDLSSAVAFDRKNWKFSGFFYYMYANGHICWSFVEPKIILSAVNNFDSTFSFMWQRVKPQLFSVFSAPNFHNLQVTVGWTRKILGAVPNTDNNWDCEHQVV